MDAKELLLLLSLFFFLPGSTHAHEEENIGSWIKENQCKTKAAKEFNALHIEHAMSNCTAVGFQ
jgi:hypothetical protein